MTDENLSGKLCARCETPLYRAELGGFALDGCGRCGGAWLEPAAAGVALAQRGGVSYHLAQKLTENTKPNPAILTRPATCPECREPLSRVTIQGEEVDVCPAHGTWFDHGELLRITTAPVKPHIAAPSLQGVPHGTYKFLELYVPAALVLAIASALFCLVGAVALVTEDDFSGWDLVSILLWLVVGPFLWLASRDVATLLLGLSQRR